MSWLAAALLWAAAAYRLHVLRQARAFTNASYAAAVACLAAAATTRPVETAIDAATSPYLSDLLQHLLVVAGGLAAQLFLLSLRVGPLVGRAVLVRTAVAAATAALMIVAFIAAPIHGASVPTGDLDVVYGDQVWVAVYRLAFTGQLVFALLDNIVLCRRHAAAPGDTGRSVNLTLVGWSCTIALVYALSRVLYVLVDLVASSPPKAISTIGSFTAVLGLSGLALGILAPRAVNGTRAWHQALRDTRRLARLWADLTEAFPQLVLRTGPPLSPRRAQLRYSRRLVEVSEGLALAATNPSAAGSAAALPAQVLALARTPAARFHLRTDTTGPSPHTPAAGDPAREQHQLLTLADTYARTTGRDRPPPASPQAAR